jgi:hypothetical protein
MYFYGIHPDRFEFLSDTATEQYYTELSADNKPANVPKTFLTIEQLQAFETLHKLDQPRKKETILYADEVKDEDEKSGVDMEAGVDLMIPVLDSDEDDSSYATEASSDTSDGDGSDGHDGDSDGSDGGDGDSDGSDEDSDGDGSDEGSDVDGSDEGSDVDGSDEGSDGDRSDEGNDGDGSDGSEGR